MTAEFGKGRAHCEKSKDPVSAAVVYHGQRGTACRCCHLLRGELRALLQSLVKKDEAVLFPVQALDTVSPPSAEQEQRVGK